MIWLMSNSGSSDWTCAIQLTFFFHLDSQPGPYKYVYLPPELKASLDSSSARVFGEGNGTPLQYSCLENPIDRGAWQAAVPGISRSRTRLRDFTFTFHFDALEKEMATHSSVLSWRIPETGSLVGCRLWGRTESHTTEATQPNSSLHLVCSQSTFLKSLIGIPRFWGLQAVRK